MPSKSDAAGAYIPARPRPLAEAQLVVLYLLSRVESATDANLLDFLTEARLMNYMEMMPALGRLAEEGAVAETLEGVCRRYRITPSGRELLALYGSRIPNSVLENVDSRLPGWQETLRAQRDYRADMAQTPRGDFEVSLRMMERGKAVMTLAVTLPSSEIAMRLCRRWQSEGASVYRALLAPLMEDEPS